MTGHITNAGAAVMLNALQRASADVTDPKGFAIPTSVHAFFAVHGDDLAALLTNMAKERTVASLPTPYDVLQIAHRVDATGASQDAGLLRCLADYMATRPEQSSPMNIGIDWAEGVTIGAAESFRALGNYFLSLQLLYRMQPTGLTQERNCERVGRWLNDLANHHATIMIGKIPPFPMCVMAAGEAVGHG